MEISLSIGDIISIIVILIAAYGIVKAVRSGLPKCAEDDCSK